MASNKAKDDFYNLLEGAGVQIFDVMANDLGGNAKTLYSIDNSINNGDPADDLLTQDVAGVEEFSKLGAKIAIVDGKIRYDTSTISGSIEALGAGDTLIDIITYAIRLGNSALSMATVTITITGTNDVPVIGATSQIAGSVTEAGLAADDTTPVTGPATATGTMAASDVDTGAVLTWSGSASGAYGSLAITAAGVWTYTLDNALADQLAEGDIRTETFTVTVTDEFGATDTETVTITVNGTNDAPVIGATSEIAGSVTAVPLFGAATTFGVGGSNPNSVAVGDVNGDGKLDVVTANTASGNGSVLLGDGSGGFGAPTVIDWNLPFDNTHSATLADVNGDGKLDIVTGNGSNQSVSVLLGDGAGGFGAPVAYSTPVGFTHEATVVDVNGDGKLDLVAEGDFGQAVLLGDGAGGFGAATVYATVVGRLGSNTAADVDGDGDADIIAAGNDSNNIAVLLNNGSGVFGSPAIYASGGNSPQNVTAVDVNGDGKADLITANMLSDNVSVLLNDGSGGFGAASTYSVGGTLPNLLSVADVNGDGKLDIITPNIADDNVSVLLGDGLGGFGAATLYDVGGDAPLASGLADLNGDGLLDILTSNEGSDDLSVLLNNGLPTATGTLTASDVDTGDSLTWSIEGSPDGTYGSLALNGNTGEWTYTLADASALAPGETHDETFTVRVTDSYGAYAEQTVTVTVTGAGDAPAAFADVGPASVDYFSIPEPAPQGNDPDPSYPSV